MDASWWPAVAAVVVLAVIAGLVDSFGRVTRAHRRPAGERRGRGGGPAPEPLPGEVWWVRIPYGNGAADADGTDSTGGTGEEMPCVVLKTSGETVTVARITARQGDGRPGVVPLPPGSVDDGRGGPGFLDTDDLHEVGRRELRRRSGPLDPAVWDQVRYLADI
ncbi:type II toxin-antitoxin system PemK/MazF family toxin [Streptomyces sp. MAR4 CNX-425]|uniref:type II toxin-antitoxin system PemK/MazF family toxin n=1 Tax=Streptomyces sp. MAR4 CNX-425 TaxID=3406343 RepID=UPI003B50106C